MSNTTDVAIGILHRVCRAICRRPDEFRMEVEELSGTIEIGIVANPTDTKRLVGHQRKVLTHLELLMTLMLRGSRKRAQFLHLESNSNEEVKFEPFVANPQWPRKQIEELLRDIVEVVFELPTVVQTVRHNAWSAKMYAIPQGDCDAGVIEQVENVVNTLFVPIGTQAGMKVYAHCHDWKNQRRAPQAIAAC